MKKTAFIGLLFLSLIYQGCEDDKDTSPPYVSILFPEESSSVSEIITIQCEASDNDSLKFVELWIDSLSTGIKDSSSPYEFSCSYGSMGGFNFWLIKTDSNGDLEWQEYYGGGGNDRAFCGLQASDGGYAIVGQSNTGGSTGMDILLVKTDDTGNDDPSQ